jgi:hypothetical protein
MVIHIVKTVKNPGFPTFFDLSVVRPRFLEVSLARKVVELEKLHRNVHFPMCFGSIPDGDSFREIVFYMRKD